MPRAKADPSPADVKSRKRQRKWAARNPERKSGQAKAYRDANASKVREGQIDYHARNPEAKRKWRLMHRYGITIEQWEAMFDRQGHACGMCRSVDPRSRYGWSTDHDHETGRFRGVLCGPCNILLGRVGDGPAGLLDFFLRASVYLAGEEGTCHSDC